MSHPILLLLKSPDPEERRAACLAAAGDPSAVLLSDGLAGVLGDPVKAVVRAASDALVEIARGAEAAGPVPPEHRRGVEDAVRDALHSDNPARRWGAAFTSARLDAPGPRLLPALVEALGCPDGDVRWAAARVMVAVGRGHGEVLPLLVGLVRGGESPMVRRMATFALRELAPDRPEAAEVLLEATDDIDLHVRRAATTAMAALLAPPPHVAERLLGALRADPDAATRRLAALALGEIAAGDPGAVPGETESQLQAAGDGAEDADLRRAALRALERLRAGRP